MRNVDQSVNQQSHAAAITANIVSYAHAAEANVIQALGGGSAVRNEALVPPSVMERVSNVKQMPRVSAQAIKDSMAQAFAQLQEQLQARREEALRNPSLSSDVPGVAYEEQENAELFGAEGPTLNDIQQGEIGDCYLLAALGSIVANDPQAIRDMIHDNGDGTYSVRFYRGDKPVYIPVDAELPVDSKGRLVYARGADSDGDNKLEIWVALVEKAYAKWRDTYSTNDAVSGYDEIDEGGHSDTVMKALTGQGAERINTSKTDEEFADLLSATNDGRLMSIWTKGDAAAGWIGDHVYTVVGTYEKDGETFVILRNPWGSDEPDGVDTMGDADDGTFAVSVDELRHVTHKVYSGEPSQEPVRPAWTPAFFRNFA